MGFNERVAEPPYRNERVTERGAPQPLSRYLAADQDAAMRVAVVQTERPSLRTSSLYKTNN